MNGNMKASDRAAIAAVIDPDVTAAGTVTSGWVDMSKFGSALAIVMAGTLGTAATLDAKIEQASDSSGTGAKDVTGLAITQMVKASNDDNQALINIRQGDLDFAGGFTHVRLSITVATASSDAGGLIIGMDPVKDVASASDLAAVVEIVG